MKRILCFVVAASVVLLLIGFVATCNSAQTTEQAKEQMKKEATKTQKSDTTQQAGSAAAQKPGSAASAKTIIGDSGKKAAAGDEVAVLETNYGTMVLEFFPKDAPGHVANFKKLAREGFYDGTKFHRIVKNFMIQGGDPNTKGANVDSYGTGGPGHTIKAEFNSRKHLKGTLSMARSQDPNSAGSQFFICLGPQPGLDGKYTVFGQLIKGTDVLEAIGKVKTKPNKYGEDSVPVDPVILKKVTIVPRAELTKVKKTGPEEGTK